MQSPRPLLLVAGFLGAGKTTLIRGLLADLSRAGMSADVILNDIANAELDAASIDPGQAASISPLAASCACCESLDELVALCGTAARGVGDLLLIELNGTADPLGILESFVLLEERLPFLPMLQVCVVDVRHWGERGELTPLERRQMEAAGLHVLSHTDQADRADVRRVEAAIGDAFPDSRRVTAEQLAGALVTKSPPALPVHDPLRVGASSTGLRPPANGRVRDDVHLLSHRVKGCQIPLPPKVHRAAIERLLDRLPDGVLRAKALVKLVDAPGSRWLFERSGNEVSPSPIPVPGITHLSPSLLCMGLQLDPGRITTLVSDAFGNAPVPER